MGAGFVLVILFLYQNLLAGETFSKTEPMFEAKLNHIGPCHGAKLLEVQVNVRMRKLSRDITAFTGNATIPYPLGSNANIVLTITKIGSNKQSITLNYNNVCEMLIKFFGNLWRRIALTMTPPIPNTCPIPKGFYKLENYTLNFVEEMAFQVPAVGKYLFTGKLFKNTGLQIFCMQVGAEVTLNI